MCVLVSLALPQDVILERETFFPEERSFRQGQRLNREAGEAVKTPGVFAKEEEQPLLGGCRTTNQTLLEILVLLGAKMHVGEVLEFLLDLN